MLRLQDFIPFDYVFGAHGEFVEKTFGFFDVKFPEDILQVYSKNQYQLIDPIAKEVFETLDFVRLKDVRKKSTTTFYKRGC